MPTDSRQCKKHTSLTTSTHSSLSCCCCPYSQLFFELWTWGEKRWSCSTHFLNQNPRGFFLSALQTSSRWRCCLAFLAQIKSIIGKYNFPTERKSWEVWEVLLLKKRGRQFLAFEEYLAKQKGPLHAKGFTFRIGYMFFQPCEKTQKVKKGPKGNIEDLLWI